MSFTIDGHKITNSEYTVNYSDKTKDLTIVVDVRNSDGGLFNIIKGNSMNGTFVNIVTDIDWGAVLDGSFVIESLSDITIDSFTFTLKSCGEITLTG